MRRLCYACGEKPARKLKTKRVHYQFEEWMKVPHFCSRGCAADWALLKAGKENSFCSEHGWWSELTHLDGCPDCPHEALTGDWKILSEYGQ